MKLEEITKPKLKNPVAKNINKVTRPATHRDKKKDYKRREKHKVNYKEYDKSN